MIIQNLKMYEMQLLGIDNLEMMVSLVGANIFLFFSPKT